MALAVDSAVVAGVKGKFLIVHLFVITPSQGRGDLPNDAHPEGLTAASKTSLSGEWDNVEFLRYYDGTVGQYLEQGCIVLTPSRQRAAQAWRPLPKAPRVKV